MNMKQLNKPWLAALLIVIAAVLIFVSVKWTNKVTHKTGRDSIYLNKEDQEEMIKAVVETCKVNNLRDCYIRLVVTRGVGTLGLSPKKCGTPQVIIIAAGIQLYPEEYYTKGMSIVTVPTTRNHHNAVNPAIKSLNYLNNILAKIEANTAGVEEAIMLNSQGYVAECTGDNIFLIKGKQLITPPLSAGAV